MNGYNSFSVHLRKDGSCKKSNDFKYDRLLWNYSYNCEYSGITHIIVKLSSTNLKHRETSLFFYNKSCREIQE